MWTGLWREELTSRMGLGKIDSQIRPIRTASRHRYGVPVDVLIKSSFRDKGQGGRKQDKLGSERQVVHGCAITSCNACCWCPQRCWQPSVLHSPTTDSVPSPVTCLSLDRWPFLGRSIHTPPLPTSVPAASLSSCTLHGLSGGYSKSVLGRLTVKMLSNFLGSIDVGGGVEIGHIG